MNRPWIRTTVALIIFAAVFLVLVVGCYRLESATFDEPANLGAGYTALKLHDYRLDPEHPPLLRMWAALPLLAIPDIKPATDSSNWLAGYLWPFCHQFLFLDNDADRLLFRARFMIALLGVLLGVLVFCWAQELFGFWPAVIVLGLYCTEPNLLAHSGLVTTDLGVTCFMFGAVYFAWRIARNFSRANLIGLTVFFALAQVSKYSAALLVPVLSVLWFVRSLRAAPWPWHLGRPQLITSRAGKTRLTALTVLGLLVVSYVALWGVYAFRYAPTPAGTGRFATREIEQRRSPRATRLLQWVDEHHLLPNASAHGFAQMAAESQRRPAYLMGEISDRGWWYYFPVAFLIKTPLALLLMAFAGLMLCAARRKTTGGDALFVLGPPAVFFGAAMAGHLNIGLRHVLPVYPFVLLLAGWTIAALLPSAASGVRSRWRSLVLAALCLTQFAELAAVYPHCLAFFNVSIGGPRHGAEYLVDSNLDWGQGLKLLKWWMTEHHVDRINLCYFGTADPTYYRIEYTELPGARPSGQEQITPPRLPGYVVISATHLRDPYMTDRLRDFYAPLRERKPVAVLGYSIYVYWIENPWW